MQPYFSLHNRTLQGIIAGILGLAIFAGISIANKAEQHQNLSQQSPAEIDIANRELAKDRAFLYDDPSLEKPIYNQLKKDAGKPTIAAEDSDSQPSEAEK
jgi:hypothetical protein